MVRQIGDFAALAHVEMIERQEAGILAKDTPKHGNAPVWFAIVHIQQGSAEHNQSV
jgi:hypothetical protein